MLLKLSAQFLVNTVSLNIENENFRNVISTQIVYYVIKREDFD